jgi:hypothetical protein
MIVVRAAQMKTMADVSRDAFEKRLSEQLGVPQSEVASGVDAAHAQGLTQERDVAQFVEQSLHAGAPPGTDAPASVAEDYPRQAVGGTTLPCQRSRHYVEIELLGEDDRPVPGEEYRIALPDGRIVTGRLNVLGKAYVPDIADPGSCQISFPALDREAWAPLAG